MNGNFLRSTPNQHCAYIYFRDRTFYKELRSKFIATIMENWEDEKANLYYIVLERGRYNLEEWAYNHPE